MRVEEVFDRVMARFIGTKHERDIKRIAPLVEAINVLEPEMQQLPDADFPIRAAELRAEVQGRLKDIELDDAEYKSRLREALEPAIVPTFALVREAGRRHIGLRHFDVQLIGGIVLHEGKIAEMKTGEGKTLVATLPAVLNALAGRGVHRSGPKPRAIERSREAPARGRRRGELRHRAFRGWPRRVTAALARPA